MQNTLTAIKTTVHIDYTTAPIIRSVARKDIPEYGLLEGQVFYMARSSKNDGTYYLLVWDYERTQWTCSCPATKPCRHIKLVTKDCSKSHSLQGYKPASKAEKFARLFSLYDVRTQEAKTAYAVVAQAEQVSQEAQMSISQQAEEQRRTAALNGNRAFSLLR